MSKPALFDREEVVSKATNLYWKKGFHATSMRNLQDEVDMRPGSIYSAFGNKDGLFKEALQNYVNMGLARIQKCRDESDTPLQALKMFVKMQVIDTSDRAPNGVCMLAKTLGELTSEHQELLDITKGHMATISAQFAKLIEEAQSVGEVDLSKDAKELASFVQIQITGLRTYAKINGDKKKLEEMIDNLFGHYPF
ncbi:TetR/AcrR family transcriptional regulator [Vibrio amylolyticus]|uniref:TetR/AcrR family transcriptional regulator n=1 Tax=Vibrio TaxID=662 RepID=UPI000C84888E|nr:TetR/AcrR family transcriptional regulator [Vibrio sp. 10N.261.55.A7]PMJ91554.1 TetR family transcriptional regulator [Vibrio sp. 10N.261.55.A7]